MGSAAAVKDEEVWVSRHTESSIGHREAKLFFVSSPREAGFNGGSDIDAAPAEPLGHGGVHVLVKIVTNPHGDPRIEAARALRDRSGPLSARRTPGPRGSDGRSRPDGRDSRAARRTRRPARVGGSPPQPGPATALLGPNHDSLDPNAVHGNARASPAGSRGHFDVRLRERRLHIAILAASTPEPDLACSQCGSQTLNSSLRGHRSSRTQPCVPVVPAREYSEEEWVNRWSIWQLGLRRMMRRARAARTDARPRSGAGEWVWTPARCRLRKSL